MPILRFHYYEVMDRDHTLIRVELIEAGLATHVYTNLPEYWDDAPNEAVYSNQVEDFAFPTAAEALAVIKSNSKYRPMTDSLAGFFSASLY